MCPIGAFAGPWSRSWTLPDALIKSYQISPNISKRPVNKRSVHLGSRNKFKFFQFFFFRSVDTSVGDEDEAATRSSYMEELKEMLPALSSSNDFNANVGSNSMFGPIEASELIATLTLFDANKREIFGKIWRVDSNQGMKAFIQGTLNRRCRAYQGCRLNLGKIRQIIIFVSLLNTFKVSNSHVTKDSLLI